MLVPILFHKVFLYAAAVISLLANGILLLLIFSRTGCPLGNYRLLLAVFALTDIFISVFHAWYIPMFILGDYGYLYFGYGTLVKKGLIATNADMIYAILFFAPFCLLTLHFVYRYCSLARPTLVTKNFPLFFSCCAVYTVINSLITSSLTSFGSEYGSPGRFNALIAEYELREIELNIRFIDYLDEAGLQINVQELFLILGQISVGGHTVFISFLCILKILKAFNNQVMDINIWRMHLHLFRALLIQFTIPVVFSLMPMTALFALPATGISTGQLGNIFGLLASVFPALDPILIILSIGRFRSILVHWFDVMIGRTARRNEIRAMEQSRLHYSMIVRRSATATS